VAFKDTPIKRKLTTLFLLTSGAVVLLTCASYFAYEYLTFRQTLLGQLSTLGKVVAANSTAAVAFGNERDAGEILAALKAERHIVAAGLYDRDGKLFSRYPANLSVDAFPPSPERDGYRFGHSSVAGFQPVAQGSRRQGTLYLKSDLGAMYQRFRLYGGIAAAVAMASLLVAFIVSTVLQRQISEPILTLASTAHAIADRRDYSVRATKGADDELGLLTDAFNQMLTRIDEQDRALRESEERLNLALMSSGIGTWSWNIVEESIIWDDYLHPLYGLAPKTFPGRLEENLRLIHPDDRRHVEECVAATLEKDAPHDVEYRVIWPDGTVRCLASRGKVYRDPAGKPVRLTGVCWDVTDRKKSEEVRQQLAAIIESATDPIMSNDLDGTIRSWNAGAVQLFGYRADEIIGRSVTLLIPDDRVEEESRIVEQLIHGDQANLFDSVRRKKDGTLVPVSLRISPIKDMNGRIVGASKIVRDITEQKRIEEERRLLVVDLERSNLELEQFASVASHDLQEPLRMVSSYTQLLDRRYGDKLDDTAREFIAYAVDGARRMQRLINDLLEFSRVGSRGKPPARVDANVVLGAVRANLSVAIEDVGALVTNEELPTVVADQTQLSQLLQNLIANAIKFHGAKPPRIHVAASERASEWVFSVRDNGIGIDPEYFDRIFAIFQRLHVAADYPGTGIGLAVCKRIAERHGGRIWVESDPGNGSTFSFSLPKSNGAHSHER
jgi:PAS domain S-box-containing protein